MWLLRLINNTAILCPSTEDALAYLAINQGVQVTMQFVEVWQQHEIKVLKDLPRGRPFKPMSDEAPFKD